MKRQITLKNLTPYMILVFMVVFIAFAFVRGSLLVNKSEKELNQKEIINEVEANKYELKEIDVKTGLLKWQITAKKGQTEEHLQAALIKDIEAKVYKNNDIVFELKAPFARANSSKKDIQLFGGVSLKNKDSSLLLMANQIVLGMSTSVEAQNGFNLILKNNGTIAGKTALINGEQTDIVVYDLENASFNDVQLVGKKVVIKKDKNGNLINATVSNGGNIILKNQNNDKLSASIIIWNKSGEIEAHNNVTFNSGDKVFKAENLTIKPDKTIYAQNKILIIHKDTKCYGNSLKYDNVSLITINGNPRVIQGGKQITANKIVYDLSTSKVQAIGNVRTSVVQQKTIGYRG